MASKATTDALYLVREYGANEAIRAVKEAIAACGDRWEETAEGLGVVAESAPQMSDADHARLQAVVDAL